MLSHFMNTAGGVVSGLSSAQIAVSRVRVSWTAPPHLPPRGYKLTVASAGINMTVQNLTQDLTISPLGPHTIAVEPLSMHYPSTPMQTSVTVVGKPYCWGSYACACACNANNCDGKVYHHIVLYHHSLTPEVHVQSIQVWHLYNNVLVCHSDWPTNRVSPSVKGRW